MFSPGQRDAYAGSDAFDTLEYMCVPPGERPSYEDALRSGAILVSVECEGPRRTGAQRIIDQAGGLSGDRLKSKSSSPRGRPTSRDGKHPPHGVNSPSLRMKKPAFGPVFLLPQQEKAAAQCCRSFNS